VQFDIIKHMEKFYLLKNNALPSIRNNAFFNIIKFLKNLKKSYQLTVILASQLHRKETFSLLTKYLFSDRTKLNLEKGLPF